MASDFAFVEYVCNQMSAAGTITFRKMLESTQSTAREGEKKMSGLTALVTNALEFAGPPAVVALCNAGFQVIAHDTAFVDTTTRDRFERRSRRDGAYCPNSCRSRRIRVGLGEAIGRIGKQRRLSADYGRYVDASIDDLRASLETWSCFPLRWRKQRSRG